MQPAAIGEHDENFTFFRFFKNRTKKKATSCAAVILSRHHHCWNVNGDIWKQAVVVMSASDVTVHRNNDNMDEW
jgi:hypothetical protein